MRACLSVLIAHSGSDGRAIAWLTQPLLMRGTGRGARYNDGNTIGTQTRKRTSATTIVTYSKGYCALLHRTRAIRTNPADILLRCVSNPVCCENSSIVNIP
jgi:hypothetical protein